MSAHDSQPITDAETIARVTMMAAEPKQVREGHQYVLVVPEGADLREVDLTGPDSVDRPNRPRGKVSVHSAASLVDFLKKHGHPKSEVWADRIRHRVVAVINANEGAGEPPGWGDHIAVFEVQLTDAWNAWTKHDGQFLSQSEFAEHIEDNLLDIAKPEGAQMLEIAQSISATVGVKFESSKRLSDGERQFEYRETVDAAAGKAGRLEIPSHIELGLRPFEGAPAYKVKARFRYRINGGHLLLAYALERPTDVINEAFDAVVAEIQKAVDQPVFFGAP